MRKVLCQFSHFCIKTGEILTAGMICYYDATLKGYYHLRSEAVRIFLTAPDTCTGELQANEEVVKMN